jgi:hypothetical protein
MVTDFIKVVVNTKDIIEFLSPWIGIVLTSAVFFLYGSYLSEITWLNNYVMPAIGLWLFVSMIYLIYREVYKGD